MSQYILINRIKVQNANATSDLTWGFPAVTHFLGFQHSLSRNLSSSNFQSITMHGCAVIAHEYDVQTYKKNRFYRFTQSRNPPYRYGLSEDKRKKTPSIIEEGKMNMTISLLIRYEGNIGNNNKSFIKWLKKVCFTHRISGGTILDLKEIELSGSVEDREDVNKIKRKLFPGFVLVDRSEYMKDHYELKKDGSFLDAWLDFVSVKERARPESSLISEYLKNNQETLSEKWAEHLEKKPYRKCDIPSELKVHFSQLKENEKGYADLIEQWEQYLQPKENETSAHWEYIPKPKKGYLVPTMVGYKAISKVYKNEDVENTRDNKTDVCFVEPIHSIGEWKSVRRLIEVEDLAHCIWSYGYEENWYLCKQDRQE